MIAKTKQAGTGIEQEYPFTTATYLLNNKRITYKYIIIRIQQLCITTSNINSRGQCTEKNLRKSTEFIM